MSDELGSAYPRLALRIERHLPGYIDAYFGPPEWKAQVEAEDPQPLYALSAQAGELLSEAQRLPAAQRRRFLCKQLSAMQTTLRILAGERIAFRDEVQGLYDISPARVDDVLFEAALKELDDLLPGDGTIQERLRARRQRFAVPAERALDLFHVAIDEVRRRTRALFSLPDGEAVDIRLVNDKPWAAYNWYLGGHRSLIEVNADSPAHANALTELMAHEGYPGHHAEHASKEKRLYEDNGWTEACVQLINAPECVISEGIATTASEIIFDDGELEAWSRAELYPRAGVNDDLPLEIVQRIRTLSYVLRGASDNAALLLHEEGMPAEEVLTYLMRFSTRTPDELQRYMRFLKDRVFRSYAFTYAAGRKLLEQVFARHDKIAVFRRVLAEPLTPADLVEWSKTPGAVEP